jgi:P27 family predicted phage terminase small subunit
MQRKTIDDHRTGGTYRPDRHGQHEAAGALLREVPEPYLPEMSPRALKMYYDVGRILVEQKMLKASDVITLQSYALEMDTYAAMMERIPIEGHTVIMNNGIEAVNPKRKIAETALRNASIMADRLGLNPAARGRIKGAIAFKDEEPHKEDVFTQFLNRKNNSL